MSQIQFAESIANDFVRIVAHLLEHETADVDGRISQILHAIDALEHNPLIGRPAEQGRRELVMGRDTRGYVALYRYAPEIDTVFVLAIRAQRECGYADDEGGAP